MASPDEVAGYLEKGLRIAEEFGIKEVRTTYFSQGREGKTICCALALALIGKVGNVEEAYRQFRENPTFPTVTMANLLECEFTLAKQIQFAHSHLTMPAREIVIALRVGTLSELG